MGASVFLQVRALLAPRIPLLPLLLSRLLHLPLSLLLFGLLAKLFPMALSVGAQWDASPLLAVRMPPDVMLILFAMAALAAAPYPCPGIYAAAEKGYNQCGRTNAPLPQRGQAPGKVTPMFNKPLFRQVSPRL